MLLPAIPLLAFLAVPLVILGLHAAPRLGAAVAVLPAMLFTAALLVPDGSVYQLPWLPSLGVELAFRLDGLSRLFALLITGIGAGVFLYAASYLRDDARRPRFLAILTLFMAAMLGAVLADDLLLLFVFWELTSLASFLLIGFDAQRAEARRAAQQGLIVTVAGGLFMLAGILLLGAVAGSFRLSTILGGAGALAGHPATSVIIVLIAIGCFAKSAQFPLHFWLPNAMAAPTPVSAYLHSATMVKLGVYLLARLNPAFQELALWQGLLTGAGAATMLAGALLALRERDLKRKLAWSTVVALGTLVTLIGIKDPLAATAAVVFLLVHALYKAALFLIAGIVDKKAGTRDAMALRGLGRCMPLTTLAALLAGLSMAGAPGFIGAFAKDLLFTAQLGVPGLLPAVALLVNAAMVVVAGVVAARPFMGRPMETHLDVKDPPLAMLAAPLVLGMLGLLFGVAPHLVSAAIIEPAAGAILGRPTGLALGQKQGDDLVFQLSLGALVLGLLMFLGWRRLQPTLAGQAWLDSHGPNAAYAHLMRGISAVSVAATRRLQPGSLRGYLAATLAMVFAGAGALLVLRGGLAWPQPGAPAGLAQITLGALVVVGALAACRLRALFGQVMAAGLVGFGLGILFLTLGAVDLAFTQFTVEILAIVLLVAILARLPFHALDARRAGERRRDALLAAGIGCIGMAVLFAVLSVPFDPAIQQWMGAAAVPDAKGRNVVNVVIVDFRALDTLGEIAVLLIAALSALVLVRRIRGAV